MRTIESTLQFAKEFPAAFAALPEPYQNDDCLMFSIYENSKTGKLFCIAAEPQPDQLSVLGAWVSWWFPSDPAWSKVPRANF